MRRLRIIGLLLAVPMLAMLLAAPGCKKGPKDEKDEDEDGGGGVVVEAVLDAPKDGIVKGVVTYKGTPPVMELITATKEKDPKACHETAPPMQTHAQKWIVNDKNQVANVVVFLKPPEGKKFQFTKAEIDDWMKAKQIPATVDLKQPHCAFVPHVVSLFTEFKVDDEGLETGQKFFVYNDAQIKHNTKITGASTRAGNKNSDQTISVGGKEPVPMRPQENPLSVGCTIHPWMSAVIWSFDHPYHSVSGNDGSFALYNVPTGVDIPVYVWHEDANAVVTSSNETFTKAGSNFHRGTMKFAKGDNPSLNLKITTK